MYKLICYDTLPEMLNTEDLNTLKFRAKLVIENLRAARSGQDVHEVCNMVHMAEGILSVLEEDANCDDFIRPLLERVERRQVEFFKKKFNF